MNKVSVIAVSAATVGVVAFTGGTADASGSSSGGWPSAYPLPSGTLMSQTSSRAVVRSVDTVATVMQSLDRLYVSQKGCRLRAAVNKPKDYLCYNAATGKTDEVYFTFAALDPTPSDASRSQTNAYLVRG